MFLSQLIVGTILICITVVIHAVALDWLISAIKRWENMIRLMFRHYWKVILLIVAVLGIFIAHVLQIWLWALFYLWVGALSDMEEALYFSTSTFTTVGYGDIFLQKPWRLLSAFQSANGFMMFGWSTAFIYEIMSKLYRGEQDVDA